MRAQTRQSIAAFLETSTCLREFTSKPIRISLPEHLFTGPDLG
jgi:hypothetical protein